jgi:hypothetical protein
MTKPRKNYSREFKEITRVFATVKRGTPYVKMRQAG